MAAGSVGPAGASAENARITKASGRCVSSNSGEPTLSFAQQRRQARQRQLQFFGRGRLRDKQAMLQHARLSGIQLHFNADDGRLRRMGFEIELQLLQDHFRFAHRNGKFERAGNVIQFESHAIERQPLHQLIQERRNHEQQRFEQALRMLQFNAALIVFRSRHHTQRPMRFAARQAQDALALIRQSAR